MDLHISYFFSFYLFCEENFSRRQFLKTIYVYGDGKLRKYEEEKNYMFEWVCRNVLVDDIAVEAFNETESHV